MTFCPPIKHDAWRPVKVQWWNPVWLCDDVGRPLGWNYCAWLWRQKQPLNACAYILGVTGSDHTFAGTKTSADIFSPTGGWQIGKVNSILPLISYRGASVEAYLGWRPNGSLGWAWRKAFSKQPGQP